MERTNLWSIYGIVLREEMQEHPTLGERKALPKSYLNFQYSKDKSLH